MKKIILTSFCIAMAIQMKTYAFDFGLKNIFSKSVQTQSVNTQTESSQDLIAKLLNIQEQSKKIDNDVQNSFLDIVSNISSQNSADSMQQIMNNIRANDTQTQTQKNNSLSEIMTGYMNEICSDKTTTITTIKNLDSTQKTNIIEDINTLINSSKQYVSLAKQTTNTISEIMKTASKTKDTIETLRRVKETTQQLSAKAQTTIKVVNQAKKITSLAGMFLQ